MSMLLKKNEMFEPFNLLHSPSFYTVSGKKVHPQTVYSRNVKYEQI